MALVALLIKCTPECDDIFRKLLADQEPQPNGRPVTQGMFLEELLETYQNPRKVPTSMPQDIEKIKSLQESVEMHANVAADTKKELDEKILSITELEHRIFLLESENTILRDSKPEPDPLSIPFKVTEVERQSILDFIAYAKRTRNLEITEAQAMFFLIRDKVLKGEAY